MPRFLLLIFFLCWTIPATGLAQVIRFAPLPMENRETVVKQFQPMLRFLEEQLNLTVTLIYTDSYEDIIDKFRAGAIDLAYLGPLPYVELRKQDSQAEAIVHFNEQSGKPFYTCAIAAMADGAIPLAGLSGRRIALTQPLSTCGYLSVAGMLRGHGSTIEDNRYAYLDKHDTVALAIVRGEYDIGGLKSAIAKKYRHLGLAILAETPPLPGFGLIANRATLPAETIRTIQDSLTQLAPTGKDRVMLETWGENLRFGAVPASDGDYDQVRSLKGSSPIPQQGN